MGKLIEDVWKRHIRNITKKDDQVDAFAYLGLMLDVVVEAASARELEEDQYLEDLRTYEQNEQGRSLTTGY